MGYALPIRRIRRKTFAIPSVTINAMGVGRFAAGLRKAVDPRLNDRGCISGVPQQMNNAFCSRLVYVGALSIALIAAIGLFAQDTPQTVLRPPKGAQVAIVVFEDLQCPMCRRTAPLLEQASRTYKIPVVRHDFPLPMHNWSYQAAVMARYFDTHSKALGNEFRDYIFQNQLEINPQNLRAYAEKFATEHKVDLPFVIDPTGKLAAEVNADRDLGNAIKIGHTPTVYIVSSRNSGKPYVEVTDNNQLYSTIDAMMKN
jgi:protein-disulfide isomerase